jgi:hypothetical protein
MRVVVSFAEYGRPVQPPTDGAGAEAFLVSICALEVGVQLGNTTASKGRIAQRRTLMRVPPRDAQ